MRQSRLRKEADFWLVPRHEAADRISAMEEKQMTAFGLMRLQASATLTVCQYREASGRLCLREPPQGNLLRGLSRVMGNYHARF